MSLKKTTTKKPAADATEKPAKKAVVRKTEKTETIAAEAVTAEPIAESLPVEEIAAVKETTPDTVFAAETAPDTAVAAEVAVQEPAEGPPDAPGFRALGLSDLVMRAVIEAGFEAPTPIQEQSIPILLKGQDLIGQAQTGTGKTAAFALPLAEKLDPKEMKTQAIVLLPTRELCIQVAQEMHNLSKYSRLRVVPVYGGQPIDRQFRALSMGAQVVVGTPGRVLDHLRRGTLNLNQVKIVVLDEADEMLNMGFLEDVEEILKDAPKERQTALFSATMPPRIAALARDYLKDPQRVSIESKRRTVALVQQELLRGSAVAKTGSPRPYSGYGDSGQHHSFLPHPTRSGRTRRGTANAGLRGRNPARRK